MSLNVFLGVDTPTTTKVKGKFGQLEFVVMIDCGATHNFVAPNVVQKAKLPVYTDRKFQVLLGTGVTVESVGVCRRVTFQLQEATFEEEFVALKLGGADVILGISWLHTLGTCLMNWESHEMSSKVGGQTFTLQGDPSLHCNSVALRALCLPDFEEVLELGAVETAT